MENCFVHPDEKKAGTCKCCGKDYCAECFLLMGPLENLVCVNCFNVLKKKYTASIKRRLVLIIVGAIVLIFGALLPVFNGGSFEMNSTTVTLGLWMIFLAGAIVVNIIRIKQMKSALIEKPFVIDTYCGRE